MLNWTVYVQRHAIAAAIYLKRIEESDVAMLNRASSISSASWVRDLMIIGLNWLCRNTDLGTVVK